MVWAAGFPGSDTACPHWEGLGTRPEFRGASGRETGLYQEEKISNNYCPATNGL